MFHVKQGRQVSPESDPSSIGRAVREKVVARLRNLSYAPADIHRFAECIERLATNLALWGRTANLTAHPDDPVEVAFHTIDSLMPAVIAAGPEPGILAGAFGADRKILDIGSGAGFPGLVLAAATAASFTLAESRRKRASFLSVTIAEMGLENVRVDTTRITPSHFSPEFDLVSARAMGEPASFYPIAANALRPSGLAMLYASPSQRLSLDAARAAGLGEYVRRAYAVERDGARVERVLAIWRKH